MANKSDRAQVTLVQLGNLKFEGLMNKDADFGISITQVCTTFSMLTKNAPRRIKALLNKDSSFLKWSSTLHSNPVNVLHINEFEKLIRILDRQGDKVAQRISDDLIGLSLHQLFCDAFKIQFEAEDRQQWLKARKQSKDTFRDSLTDALKAYGYTEPWQYGKFIHAMQARIGIADGTRDSLSDAELIHLSKAQMYVGMAVEDFQMDPYHALERYVATARALKK